MSPDPAREAWLERFVERLAALSGSHDEPQLRATAEALWPTRGQMAPDAAAEAEHLASGPALRDDDRFERTERIPVERITASADYVRDDAEWIARCVARVLELDAFMHREEAARSVTDLAGLERWRTMRPEAAAEQLYTPIRLSPE